MFQAMTKFLNYLSSNSSQLILLAAITFSMNACLIVDEEDPEILIDGIELGEDPSSVNPYLTDSNTQVLYAAKATSLVGIRGQFPADGGAAGSSWSIGDLKGCNDSYLSLSTRLTNICSIGESNSLFKLKDTLDFDFRVGDKSYQGQYVVKSNPQPLPGDVFDVGDLLEAMVETMNGASYLAESSPLEFSIIGPEGIHNDIKYLNVYINGRIWNGWEKVFSARTAYQDETTFQIFDPSGKAIDLDFGVVHLNGSDWLFQASIEGEHLTTGRFSFDSNGEMYGLSYEDGDSAIMVNAPGRTPFEISFIFSFYQGFRDGSNFYYLSNYYQDGHALITYN